MERGTPRSYTAEFKLNALRMHDEGKSERDVSQELGIPSQTLEGWIRKRRKGLKITDSCHRTSQALVRISPAEEKKAAAVIRYGKLSFEMAGGFSSSDIRAVIEALGGKDAL